MLALLDFESTFVVESDANSTSIGAVLSQNRRPIAFFSKALGHKHQVLLVCEQEMIAILVAIKKWNTYLMGKHFQILTDHYNLKFLLD